MSSKPKLPVAPEQAEDAEQQAEINPPG